MVTSNYHTRRARYVFRNVFEPQVAMLIVSAHDADYDPDNWWETRQGRKLFFLESVSYLTAIWESWSVGDSVPSAAGGSPVPNSGVVPR